MSMKYLPFIIMGIVILMSLIVHWRMPNSSLDKQLDSVAEQVIKDQTGLDVDLNKEE